MEPITSIITYKAGQLVDRIIQAMICSLKTTDENEVLDVLHHTFTATWFCRLVHAVCK